MDKDRAAAIAAIAAWGEEIKTNSAAYLWVCRGIKTALPPPDKPVVLNRNNSSGAEAFEAAMRRDAEGLKLRACTPSGVGPVKPR